MGDTPIGSINSKRVLNEVVGTDRGKVDVRNKAVNGNGGRGHFNHGPNAYFWIESQALCS